MAKKASKKKGNRKFEIVLQIADWNRGFTGVKKYVPQSVFVWAKTREKAIKKFDELHGISVLLCVKGQVNIMLAMALFVYGMAALIGLGIARLLLALINWDIERRYNHA